MDEETLHESAYRGTKAFTQLDVKTANATGFGAAADDYMERGIDLNEQLIRNKPATFFFRMAGDAMEGAGIYAGESLAVCRAQAAQRCRAHRVLRFSNLGCGYVFHSPAQTLMYGSLPGA